MSKRDGIALKARGRSRSLKTAASPPSPTMHGLETVEITLALCPPAGVRGLWDADNGPSCDCEATGKWNPVCEAPHVMPFTATDACIWVYDPDEDATVRFDWIAQLFYDETGYMRPGKSQPPDVMDSDDDRQRVWDAWIREKHRALRDFVWDAHLPRRMT